MTLGWAAPQSHPSRKDLPVQHRFSMAPQTPSGPGPMSCAATREGGIRRGTMVSPAGRKCLGGGESEQDQWWRGGRAGWKGCLKRDRASLLSQEKILFQRSSKWVSQQSGFPARAGAKCASFTSGTSLTPSPFSPQAVFTTVPVAE